MDDKIEINKDFELALDLMNNSTENVFITGRAGTGKSTLLQYFRDTTEKKIVVVAPTGVAAVNIDGQTIHSFFKFGIGVTPNTVRNINDKSGIYKNIDCLVIDEISMVRADLIDCIDKFMRLNGKHKSQPFGGVQIIAVGDLYQLPPVVTREDEELFKTFYSSPYFFDSKVFSKTNFNVIELQKIYRQTDQNLIDILNAVRIGEVGDKQIEDINRRHCDELTEEHDSHIHLVTTNSMADSINARRLSGIEGKVYSFRSRMTGKFQRNFPTNDELFLKIGARVMLLSNDSEGRWINGDLAEVMDVNEVTNTITVKLEGDSEEYDVTPYEWKMIKYFFDKKSQRIDSESVGTFVQFPLRLAWALTIHKGQGKTYSHVIVDFGQGTFAHGQAYVALSRCKNLEGLVLRVPLQKEHVIVDKRVLEWMGRYKEGMGQGRLVE